MEEILLGLSRAFGERFVKICREFACWFPNFLTLFSDSILTLFSCCDIIFLIGLMSLFLPVARQCEDFERYFCERMVNIYA